MALLRNVLMCAVLCVGFFPFGVLAQFNLGSIDGSNGFKIEGQGANDETGASVASVGDINNDGLDDVAFVIPDGIGASAQPTIAVMYGTDTRFETPVSVADINGSFGFLVTGVSSGGALQLAGSIGDINNDGFSDFAVSDNQHIVYVIFGRQNRYETTINLTQLDGVIGFSISTTQANDGFGASIAKAGDFNLDGIDDFIIGAPQDDTRGNDAGAAYIIYGNANGFNAVVNASTLDDQSGMKINGTDVRSETGTLVEYVEDFNGDGTGDVVITSPLSGSQQATILLGGSLQPAASIDLSSLTEINSIKLMGDPLISLQLPLSFVGDVNADGFSDISISPETNRFFLIQGRATVDQGIIDLTALQSNGLFEVTNSEERTPDGLFAVRRVTAVKAAGDVNNDGIDDMVVQERGTVRVIGANVIRSEGALSVIFGSTEASTDTFVLPDIRQLDGFTIPPQGEITYFIPPEYLAIGDFNGDGANDYLVGVPSANPNMAVEAGSVYVVYGVSGGIGFVVPVPGLGAIGIAMLVLLVLVLAQFFILRKVIP